MTVHTPISRRERWSALSERLMLLLAVVSIGLYLADLKGFWARAGAQSAYEHVSLVIDCVFVVDLLLKILLERRAYLLSPWFFIDFVSTLPIVSAIAHGPHYLTGLRSIRGFRFLRTLRTLRTLRVVRTLRLLRMIRLLPTQSAESRTYDRALLAASVVYSAAFMFLMHGVHSGEFIPAGTSADEIEFFTVVGSILGMALLLVLMRFQMSDISMESMRLLLNVALPHQVAEHFLRHPTEYDRTQRAPASIIFCDLKGFTRSVESLGSDLDDLKRHLEKALDAVVEAHKRHDLIVDKFIGDAVMSFRGGDLVTGDARDHAKRVVRAGLDSVAALRELDDPIFRGIKIGGASAPDCLIGTFGTSGRLTYTVLGSAVNLAARLEPASALCGVNNLYCETTHALTAGADDLAWRHFGAIRVPGRDAPIEVYEAFYARELEGAPWLESYHLAWQAYRGRRFGEARQNFLTADRGRTGGDPASKILIHACERWLETAPPEGWTPVLDVDTKAGKVHEL